MNDIDKLVVMLHQAFMNMEAEIEKDLDNREKLAKIAPSPARLQDWRDTVLLHNYFKALQKRLTDVIDFYGQQGV